MFFLQSQLFYVFFVNLNIIRFINTNELKFTLPPLNQITFKKNNSKIGYNSIIIEISINGEDYTKNKREISFIKSPNVDKIHINNEKTTQNGYLYLDDNGKDYIYAILKNLDSKHHKFIKNVGCKYTSKMGKIFKFEGRFISYPYNSDKKQIKNAISCKLLYYFFSFFFLTIKIFLKFKGITKKTTPGEGSLSFTINGFNYFGNIKIKVRKIIKIDTISKQCGPTNLDINTVLKISNTQNFKTFSQFFLAIGSSCYQFSLKETQYKQIKYLIFLISIVINFLFFRFFIFFFFFFKKILFKNSRTNIYFNW